MKTGLVLRALEAWANFGQCDAVAHENAGIRLLNDHAQALKVVDTFVRNGHGSNNLNHALTHLNKSNDEWHFRGNICANDLVYTAAAKPLIKLIGTEHPDESKNYPRNMERLPSILHAAETSAFQSLETPAPLDKGTHNRLRYVRRRIKEAQKPHSEATAGRFIKKVRSGRISKKSRNSKAKMKK